MQKTATKQNTAKNTALRIAITAMFAAVLSGGKLALSALPNIEIVTITIAVCAFVWGISYALPAVVVFITCDIFIWGFNTWVISYFVYWPLVAVAFWLLGKVKFRNGIIQTVFATLCAVVLTFLFGVITSIVDTLLGYSNGQMWVVPQDFFYRFSVLYARGIVYFLLHIVSNLAIFAVAFLPVQRLNVKIKQRLFPPLEEDIAQSNNPTQLQ